MNEHFQKLFDAIIGGDTVELDVEYHVGKTLYHSLLRKFRIYKNEMDKVGYLDPALEASTIEWAHKSRVSRFNLKSKPAKPYEFRVIPKEESHAADV